MPFGRGRREELNLLKCEDVPSYKVSRRLGGLLQRSFNNRRAAGASAWGLRTCRPDLREFWFEGEIQTDGHFAQGASRVNKQNTNLDHNCKKTSVQFRQLPI